MSKIKSYYVLVSLISVMSFSLTACQSEAKPDSKYDCSASEALAVAKANDKSWSMQQTDKSGKTAINFTCDRMPFVGDFQKCHIQLNHKNKARYADAIAIDGGMKAHGHGLPTVPTLVSTSEVGYYKIEGLKYSMPGAWTVGFQVNVDDVTEQLVFDFTIE